MAMPATGRFIVTPASISASDLRRPSPSRTSRSNSVISERCGSCTGNCPSPAESDALRARQVCRGRFRVVPGRSCALSPHRIGREIVVQHEVLLVGTFERVDELFVFARAQRCHDKRLRLAAGEQRGAMRARQHADFGAMGRTVLRSRPSMRWPVSSTAKRITSASSSLNRPLRLFSSILPRLRRRNVFGRVGFPKWRRCRASFFSNLDRRPRDRIRQTPSGFRQRGVCFSGRREVLSQRVRPDG